MAPQHHEQTHVSNPKDTDRGSAACEKYESILPERARRIAGHEAKKEGQRAKALQVCPAQNQLTDKVAKHRAG
jgi:hypothetical protein